MIRTLLVGFGFSATTFHLPFLTQLPAFTVSGVVSSRPDDVAAVLPNVPVYSSLAKALDAGQFDLAVITTPNTYHAMQARQALMANVHVLVEKPFTLSTADADAEGLVALAQQKQRKLCVYHNRRFDGDFLTISDLITSGKLGTIKQFHSRFDRFRPHPRDRWRENAGPGAGIFWDLGPHLIDQAVQLFGIPKQVHADICIAREGGQSDDSFDISLFFDGITARLGSSPFQANTTLRFDVQGEKGSYRKFGLDPQEAQLKQGMAFSHAEWAKTPDAGHGELATAEGINVYPTKAGAYVSFYAQLANAISHNDDLPADAQTVLPVIKLIELAFESAETGKVMPVYVNMKENN